MKARISIYETASPSNTHILTYQTIFCIINLYIDIWNHTMQYEPYDNSIKEIKEEEKKGPKMTKLNVFF